MKDPIVADTSAYISLASITDSNHKKALEISRKIGDDQRPIIIPSDVFTEILNVLGRSSSHELAGVMGKQLLESKNSIILDIDHEVRRIALSKFQKQATSVSYTDCVVMAHADVLKTKEIFGFDKVFKQNGYIRFGIDTASS